MKSSKSPGFRLLSHAQARAVNAAPPRIPARQLRTKVAAAAQNCGGHTRYATAQ